MIQPKIASLRLRFRAGFLPERAKAVLKLLPIFLAMIILGMALAFYADSQLLIVPFLGALTLVSFAALDYALYVLVAFLPFSFRFIFAQGTEIQIPTEPLLAIMALAIFLRWIVVGRVGVQIKFPFRFPLVLYAASIFLSLLNASRLYSAAKGSLRAVSYMMLAVVVFNVITDRRRLKWLFILSITSATAAVGWTVIFLVDRLDMLRWGSAYAGLPFVGYTHYGAFVAVILLILLARSIFDREVYDRVLWTALLVFFGISLCFSLSRGVWASFIAALGFMLLQRSKGVQHKKILLVGGAFVFLIFLLIIPSISGLIMSRIRSITNLGYATNRERIIRWGVALMMFLSHPIIGCGYGSFAFTFVNDPGIMGTYMSQYKMGAHNEYLQALAETGLIGFLAWILMIVFFFRYGFRLLKRLNYDQDPEKETESVQSEEQARITPLRIPGVSFWRAIVIGIMGAEFSLLVHFLVNNLIQSDIVGVPFWLLMGLLPAVGNILERETISPKQALKYLKSPP